MVKVIKWLIRRRKRQEQIVIAYDILVDILKSKDYHISNPMAEKIIETVIKSNGNKVIEFILKD
jgi:Ca2+-binding EF-hand superfamily protein